MADPARAPTELEKAKADIFGANPVLGPDGQPMERGHGSRFQAMSHRDRAHFEALNAQAAVDELVTMSKNIVAAAERVAAAAKATLEAAAAAKAEPVTVAEPAIQETEAERLAREQRVREAEQRAARPAA